MESEDLPKPCRTDDKPLLSPMGSGIYISISCLCSILAIAGNGLIIFLVYKKQSLRNVSNFFLCSLAVADLWAGLVPIHINTSVVYLGILLTCNTLKKVHGFFGVHLLVITTMNVCAVSIDRLIAVKWPLRYPSIMTPSATRRTLLFIWITSILFAIPMACGCHGYISFYWLFISISTIIISCLVFLYCYSVILRITHTQQRRIIPTLHLQPPSQNGRQLGPMKNRKAMTRFLGIITLFILAFLPNLICAILILYPFKKCPWEVQAMLNNWEWCALTINLSPFVNPCIYALSNKQFRSAFKNIIMRRNRSTMQQAH